MGTTQEPVRLVGLSHGSVADELRIVGFADQRLAQVHATTPDHPEHGTQVGALRTHPC